METTNNVQNVLEETLKNLKAIIDVDSIIGKPITQGENIIIPISKVSVGFISGGGEINIKKKVPNFGYPFTGGSGGGCNITPIGFLCVNGGNVNFIKVETTNSVEKIIDVVSNLAKSVK